MIDDVTSTSYARLLKILPVIDKGKLSRDAATAYDLLLNWDGKHELDNIEPTIYYRFLYQVYLNAFEDELGKEAFAALESTISLKRNTTAFLLNDSSKWWNDIYTTQTETRKEILTRALNKAVTEIHASLGDNTSDWAWKNVHTIQHKHPMGVSALVVEDFSM
jgi:penicillin amidase